MERLQTIEFAGWDATFSSSVRQTALEALEAGRVLYFPGLSFPLEDHENRFLDPAILDQSKNASYNPAKDSIGGTVCTDGDAADLKVLIRRYSTTAQSFLNRLLAHYGPALKRERASLRPAKAEGRVQSWRKDDTRLHVDSFPSKPTGGRRILRLFCNVNPNGRPRTWRVGEPFEDVAKRFWPELPAPGYINRQILSLFRVTKGFRSAYDHYMLQLHDAMKADEEYQRTVSQETIHFPAGSAWACYADQVSHAAMAGQHQFEQTFSLPVEAMENAETSPLRTLERIAGRALAEHHRLSQAG
ncbi:Kdo hydroxylase family protein [Zavarzinella formosa]|uniref:Kdo hydroxylase family protein n=1 Tax=Zavarzinella formosa TaxID=360055 RepID=UPI0003148367|nr:Kdo hydroxylase family protein [Zavarzinella formosa]